MRQPDITSHMMSSMLPIWLKPKAMLHVRGWVPCNIRCMPQKSYPSFPNTLLGTVLNRTRFTHCKTTCRRDWIIRIFHQDWPLRLHLLGTFPLVWYSRHGSNILNFPDRLHTTSCQTCSKKSQKNILKKSILKLFGLKTNKKIPWLLNDSENDP